MPSIHSFHYERLFMLLVLVALFGLAACNQTEEHDWKLYVYPSPSLEVFSVHALGTTPEVVTVRVTNAQGQIMDERLFDGPNPNVRVQYNLGNQGIGPYTVTLLSGSSVLEYIITVTVQ